MKKKREKDKKQKHASQASWAHNPDVREEVTHELEMIFSTVNNFLGLHFVLLILSRVVLKALIPSAPHPGSSGQACLQVLV